MKRLDLHGNQLPAVFSNSEDDDFDELWSYRPPLFADHIRVNRGLYYHHGIYVTSNEVIHFTGNDNDNLFGETNKVISTSLQVFLKQGKCEKRLFQPHEKAVLRPKSEIVKIARVSLGLAGYDLFDNNCEHFCNRCLFNRHESKQIDKLSKGNTGMGLFDLFSRDKTITNISYVYEPDKVKMAEIEAKTSIILKEMEDREIKIKAESQKEVMQELMNMQKELMQYSVESAGKLSEIMLSYTTAASIALIERHSEVKNKDLDSIDRINKYYDDTMKSVSETEQNFEKNELAPLVEKMKGFAPGTAEHLIYTNYIEKKLEVYYMGREQRLRAVNEQRTKLVDSYIDSRIMLEEHLRKMTEETKGLISEGMQNFKLDAQITNKVLETNQNNNKLLKSEFSNNNEEQAQIKEPGND